MNRFAQLRRVAAMLATIACAFALSAVQVDIAFPDDALPPASAAYYLARPMTFRGTDVRVDSGMLHAFAKSGQPPRRGQTTSVQTGALLDMTGFAGGSQVSESAPALMEFSVTNVSGGGKVKDYSAELSQLDVAGSRFMLRESPSFRSVGGVQTTRVPGGNFRIVSFFDVFVDVSVDGGATWFAASDAYGNPVRVRLYLAGM